MAISKREAAKKIASKVKTKTKSKRNLSVERYQSQGQGNPQSKAWTEPNDEGVAAKPIGWRWTNLGASKLGIGNPDSRPSNAQIESYRNKSFKVKGETHRYLYTEKRVDKSDKNRSAKFYAGGTTGAGSFQDGGTVGAGSFAKGGKTKELELLVDSHHGVYVPQVFVENYDLKEFGFNDKDIAYFKKAFSDSQSDDYFDAYEKMESKAITKDGSTITTADGDLWLVPKGYNYDDLFYMKKGGATFGGRQYDPYSEDADGQKIAKPIGWRFTDKLAKRLNKNLHSRPTNAEVEKYAGRGVYYEARQDKSDAKPSKNYISLEDGGTTGAGMFKDGGYIDFDFEDKSGKYTFVTKRYAQDNFDIDEVYGIDKNTHKSVLVENKKDINNFGTFMVQIDEYKKGGATFGGRQNEVYNEDSDGQKIAKPVGWRFTNKLANRLDRNPHSRPSVEEIEKYRNRKNGIYREARQDKSDLRPSKNYISLEDGGTLGAGNFAAGGSVGKTNTQRVKNLIKDLEQTPYTIGLALLRERLYSWAENDLKNLKNNPKKWSDGIVGAGMYKDLFERIIKYTKFDNLENGGDIDGAGMFARGGGVERVANTQSRDYSENLIPFKGNNLEGKTLDNGDYVVLSYGYYPIWWYCKAEGKWYGNSTKYSVTTSKQMTQSRPTYDAKMVTKNELTDLMMKHHARFEDGGMLDGILGDTGAATTNGVGGTSFSSLDLTSNMDLTNPAF